ncbi:hypothetical protein GCM10022291_18860 [Postechiella marina]|uniref:Uncharacterized protein n=1 Tax=Postechiella marina TaxID=943941 RepID=A0ABP8C9A0_9FLAO
MKKIIILLSFVITYQVNSQITTQDCGNFNSVRISTFEVENSKLERNGFVFQKKVYTGFNIIVPDELGVTPDGAPIIAKGHIEKVREKIWFDSNNPSNNNISNGEYLNGWGVNYYPNTFDSFFKINTRLGVGKNNYAYYSNTDTSVVFDQSGINFFLGGENNFPSNEIFRKIRYSVYIYVKEEYAHLYPGGINNRIYQFGKGTYQGNENSIDSNGYKYVELDWSISVDKDNDGILNEDDNCPSVSNANQLDTDDDGVGNICDNCINNYNPNQSDIDGDGIGDFCDDDIDGDGILNNIDNCATNYNPNQEDNDNDGIGDLCDFDSDNDGVLDVNDNCPNEPNANQTDIDGDGIGDVCDEEFNKPNLTLTKVVVKVGKKTYTIDSETNKNDTPIFKKGENHTFTITIKNDDDGRALSSNYMVLVSEEAKYPDFGSKPAYEYRRDNIGAINGNSKKSDSFSTYIYDYISSLNLKENKTYYLIFDIDYNGSVDESNEKNSDNIKYVPFKYSKSGTSKKAYLNTKSGLIEIPLDNYLSIPFDREPLPSPINQNISLKENKSKILIDRFDDYISPISTYNLKIFKLIGNRLVVNKNITAGSVINTYHLSSGIYAIHVNNKYIKKIKIFKGSEPIRTIPIER